MSDFNYQEYLRNNPLFKKETTILTEGKKTETIEENSIRLDNNLLIALTDLVDSHSATSGLTDQEAVMEVMEFLGQEYDVAFEFGRMMQEEMPGKVDMLASKIMKALNAGYIDKSEAAELRKALADGNIDFVEMILSDDEGMETDYMKRRREDDDYLQEKTSKSKMSEEELKAKIKEDIYSILNEEEEDEVEDEEEIEDVEVEDVEDMEPAEEAPAEGLSQDEKEIQDNLKLAYDNAVAIGDKKLADQIGNSITFFTRTHVVER